jgi:hypothetical protein
VDTTFFHDLPGYALAMFAWASKQNGAVAFGAGAIAWFLLERIFGFVTNPIGKIMSFLGFAFVICFAVAFMTDFAGSYERGTTPFMHHVQTPNATTLKDLQ